MYRPALFALGNALFGQERYEEAIEVLLGSQPGEQEHRVLAQIGLSYEKLERWTQAEAVFRGILEQISSSYLTRYAAVALHDHGPFSADMHHGLARVLQRQGNREEAWLHYHLARRVDPTIELDPMFREILTDEDIENHVGFDTRQLPKPAKGDALVDRIGYALQLEIYDELVASVAELGLDLSVSELAQYIRVSQEEGQFVLAARFRLLGDVADGRDARALYEVLSAGGCLQLLEIAEVHHAGRATDSNAEELARRIELDAGTLVAFVALLRRYLILQPETSRSVVMMARAALNAAPQKIAHGYASLLWGEYMFATRQMHDAAKSLAAACVAFDQTGDLIYAVESFEKLCRAQHGIGKVADAEASARTFVALARRGQDAETIVAALGILAQFLGTIGKFQECFDVASEASALLGDIAGASPQLREGIESTLHLVSNQLSGSNAHQAQDVENGQSLTARLKDAERLIENGDPGKAKPLLEAVVALARTQNRTADLVEGLLLLGRVARTSGRLDEALKLLNESLSRSKSSSFPLDKVPVLVELAQTASDAGDGAAAIEHAERALQEARRQRDRQYEAHCHHLLASLLVEADKARAVEHFGAYLNLLGNDETKSGGSAESNLLEKAQSAFEVGDFSAAIENFETFIETSLKGSPQHLTALANLALVRYHAGDADGAIRGLDEATAGWELAGNRRSAVGALVRSAKVRWERKMDLTATVSRLTDAAHKCDNSGERRGCLTTAASALADINLFSEAEALAKAGLALADSTEWRDARDAIDCRMTLGRACRTNGRFSEAVAHYEEALKGAIFLKDEPLEGTIRGWKAISHRYLGQLDVAADEYGKAISIAQLYHNPSEEVMHRTNLVATLRDLQQEDCAREHALAALELSARVDNPRVRERVLSMLYLNFRPRRNPFWRSSNCAQWTRAIRPSGTWR
ncbi:tetratricopeptide repeat protein [Rhizobium laguerreae]|uniref:tetratricopeptide repeat protein n=1 Tax=Rhizobium laguerreae TaxID=1076926 RepID=UPI0021B0C784|nr:tetratricopeptide repeat protein [Rhizobium laguerreae]